MSIDWSHRVVLMTIILFSEYSLMRHDPLFFIPLIVSNAYVAFGSNIFGISVDSAKLPFPSWVEMMNYWLESLTYYDVIVQFWSSTDCNLIISGFLFRMHDDIWLESLITLMNDITDCYSVPTYYNLWHILMWCTYRRIIGT